MKSYFLNLDKTIKKINKAKQDEKIFVLKNNLEQFMLNCFKNNNENKIIYDFSSDMELYKKIHNYYHENGLENRMIFFNFSKKNYSDILRFNVINHLSSEDIVQFLSKKLDIDSMWNGRALYFFENIIKIIFFIYKKNGKELSFEKIKKYCSFEQSIKLLQDTTLPQNLIENLKTYFSSLPGFIEEKGLQQCQSTLTQHGYLEMILTYNINNSLKNLSSSENSIKKIKFSEKDNNLIFIKMPEKGDVLYLNDSSIIKKALHNMLYNKNERNNILSLDAPPHKYIEFIYDLSLTNFETMNSHNVKQILLVKDDNEKQNKILNFFKKEDKTVNDNEAFIPFLMNRE